MSYLLSNATSVANAVEGTVDADSFITDCRAFLQSKVPEGFLAPSYDELFAMMEEAFAIAGAGPTALHRTTKDASGNLVNTTKMISNNQVLLSVKDVAANRVVAVLSGTLHRGQFTFTNGYRRPDQQGSVSWVFSEAVMDASTDWFFDNDVTSIRCIYPTAVYGHLQFLTGLLAADGCISSSEQTMTSPSYGDTTILTITFDREEKARLKAIKDGD